MNQLIKRIKKIPNRTILYYSIEIYTGRDYYPDKEKKQLVHEKIYLNCVNYGKTAMELVNKVKKGSYVQVSGELRPNNYDREDGKSVWASNHGQYMYSNESAKSAEQ